MGSNSAFLFFKSHPDPNKYDLLHEDNILQVFNPFLTIGLAHPYHLGKSIRKGFLADVFIFLLHRNFCKLKVYTLIRCSILHHLNWVCTAGLKWLKIS